MAAGLVSFSQFNYVCVIQYPDAKKRGKKDLKYLVDHISVYIFYVFKRK